MQRIYQSKTAPGRHKTIEGVEAARQGHRHRPVADRAHAPARTRPPTPACSTTIRKLFAQTQEAKVRGYLPGRFSFNVKGGRCEACAGDGTIKIEMHFLPDVYVPCEVCKGARYNRDTLDITFKGKNIAEVLDLSVRGGARVLRQPAGRSPATCRRSSTSGSATSGSASRRTTLSGGEAQRVKLASRAGQAVHRATRSTSSTSRPPASTSRTSASCSSVLQRLVDAGQHRARDRAQPRRHQDRRLGHRPRPRGRRRRRPGRGRGPARGRGQGAGVHTGRFLANALGLTAPAAPKRPAAKRAAKPAKRAVAASKKRP